MSRLLRIGRGATAVATLAGLAACSSDVSVVTPHIVDPLFASYVSIGNSITAGYQSGGINDSTQRRSYAVLLANDMGTRFAFPSLSMPGCAPPIANFLTQARVGNAPANACLFRSASGFTSVLNNVAVPGALTQDPTSVTTANSNALTTLILGGRTQVERALEAAPTFASVWIGNNDVLSPALTGLIVPTPGVTAGLPSLSSMQTNYDKILTQLLAGAPGLKGILIGIVNVTNVPALVPAPFFTTAGGQQFINAATGKTVMVDPTCATSTSLVSLQILGPIRNFDPADPTKPGTHPPVISCGAIPGLPAPVGNIFILDAAEQAAISARVAEFNAWISAKAQGATPWAYYDPNILLTQWKSQNLIFFNPASATATFGQFLSLDGVHPSSAAHVQLAEELRKVINAKFSTSLGPIS